MVRNKMIATLLAAVLAFSPAVSTPASAAPDAEDYARVMLGLLALGVLVETLDNDRDRRLDRRESERARSMHRRIAACEFEVRTRNGWRDVYGSRCLERAGVRVSRLPRDCAFRVRGERGNSVVYGERCLEDYGYRFEVRSRR